VTLAQDCDGIIEDFVTESCESLDMAVDDVLSLEQGPDQEAIDRIFRVVHTIKGTAGMLDFTALSGFVHALEDVCADIRAGRRGVDRRTADGLLRCLDLIREKLEFIGGACREDADYSCGCDCLDALRADAPSGREGVVLDLDGEAEKPRADDASELLHLSRRNMDCKALIVEDDFVSRKVLHSFLSRFSTCYVAKDGSEAIQAVTESYLGPEPEPFSLIFMDVMMPVIDGLQATTAIRALERAKGAGYSHPAAKIIVVTALEDSEVRRRAIQECGADVCLSKPLDLTELRAIIEDRVLLTQGSGREGQCA